MKTIIDRDMMIMSGILTAAALPPRVSASSAAVPSSLSVRSRHAGKTKPATGPEHHPEPGRKQSPARVINPDKPMVALTFDDGPSSIYTPAILDILEEHNSAATFFVLGQEAERHPEILQRIVNEGNEIGNHTYSHLNLTLLSDAELSYQIETPRVIIQRITGYAPSLLRPSYGFINDDLIKKIPYPIILWSLDTVDWESRNADAVYNKIIQNVRDGDIILMHDIYASTVEAVKRIVPELIRRGYQIVSVSEMSKARGVALQPGKVYSNMYR